MTSDNFWVPLETMQSSTFQWFIHWVWPSSKLLGFFYLEIGHWHSKYENSQNPKNSLVWELSSEINTSYNHYRGACCLQSCPDRGQAVRWRQSRTRCQSQPSYWVRSPGHSTDQSGGTTASSASMVWSGLPGYPGAFIGLCEVGGTVGRCTSKGPCTERRILSSSKP